MRRIWNSAGLVTATSLIIVNGLGLVGGLVQARLLGPEGRGQLAAAMVPATLLMMVLTFGIPDQLARRAAQGINLPKLTQQAIASSLVAFLVCLIPYIAFAQSRDSDHGPIFLLLLAAAFLLPVTGFGYMLTAIMSGAGRWHLLFWVRLVSAALQLIGISTLAYWMIDSPLVVGLVLLGVTAIGPLLLLAETSVRNTLKHAHSHTNKHLRALWRESLTAWPAGVASLLTQRADLLVIAFIATTLELGNYTIATTMAFAITSIANGFAPAIQRDAAQESSHKLRRSLVLLSSLTAMAGVTVGGIVNILVVPKILGSEFTDVSYVTSILLVAQVPLAISIALNASLVGSGFGASRIWGELATLGLLATGTYVAYVFGGIGAVPVTVVGARALGLVPLIYIAQKKRA